MDYICVRFVVKILTKLIIPTSFVSPILIVIHPIIYPSSLLPTHVQKTVTRDGQQVELRGKGRHDPCVLPRAVPMVEAMVCLTLVDALMMQQAQCELFPNEASEDEKPNPMGVTAQREGGPRYDVTQMVTEDGEKEKALSQRIDEE